MPRKTFAQVGSEVLRVTFVDNSQFKKLSKEGAIKGLNEITKNLAMGLSVAAMRKMTNVLLRKHAFRVGASEKAAHNFVLEPLRDSRGVSYIAVAVGDLTIANTKIREGMKPGSWPSIETLKKWAANKGWTPKSYYKPEKEAIASYTRTSVLGNVHTVKAYIRRKKGEKRKEEDDPYYLIGRAIYLHGTGEGRRSDPGPLWKRLPPVGDGRFDYVSYIMRQDASFAATADKIMADAREVFIEYMSSGRKTGGRKTYVTGG